MFDRLKHALGFPHKAAAKGSQRGRRVTPEVDSLESRELLTLVPSGLAPQLVTELYSDLFHRQVTTPELNYNVAALQHGEPVEALVGKLVTSNERKADEVVAYYEGYLDRVPDLGGLVTYGVSYLNQGNTTVQLQEKIIASPEFQTEHPTNASYVTALYADILGRSPSASESSVWINALTYGTSRATMAQIMFNSKEYAKLVINSDFELVLNRAARAGEIAFWTPNVLSAQSDAALLTGLFTSPENFKNLSKMA